MTLVLLLGIAMLLGAAIILADLATLPARQRRASIGRATKYGGVDPFAQREVEGFRTRALEPAFGRLGRFATRFFPKTALDSIEQRLVTSGLGLRISAPTFLITKGVMAFTGLLVGVLIGSSSGGAFRGLLFGLAFGAGFFVLPDRFVAGRIRNRKETIEGELPDALDLLAISVEAGLSLDAAIGQMVDHMEGPLVDEFELTLGEIRIGQTRQDALRALAERVDVRGITALTRAIIQSEQLGISLGRILRTQARDARNQRQAAAEERANKMPIKMLLPTALFIFPALFLVVVGPSLITLFQVL